MSTITSNMMEVVGSNPTLLTQRIAQRQSNTINVVVVPWSDSRCADHFNYSYMSANVLYEPMYESLFCPLTIL